jgi:hypothetical protein
MFFSNQEKDLDFNKNELCVLGNARSIKRDHKKDARRVTISHGKMKSGQCIHSDQAPEMQMKGQTDQIGARSVDLQKMASRTRLEYEIWIFR